MTDPYRTLNRAHREAVDTPWQTPRRPAPVEPLLVQGGRAAKPWIDWIAAACCLALGLTILARVAWASLSGCLL